MMGWKSRFPWTESGFFLLGSKTCKPLVEARHPALRLGFAFLAGVDRVRGTGNVEGDVGVADAIGMHVGLVCFDGRADQPEGTGSHIVKQNGAVVGVNAWFHCRIP